MHMVGKDAFLAVVDRYGKDRKEFSGGVCTTALQYDTRGEVLAMSVFLKTLKRTSYYVRGCMLRRFADEELKKVGL